MPGTGASGATHIYAVVGVEGRQNARTGVTRRGTDVERMGKHTRAWPTTTAVGERNEQPDRQQGTQTKSKGHR